MKKPFLRYSMLVLALAITLNHFYSLPDMFYGLLLGISIGLGIISIPKFKQKISKLKKIFS